MVDLGTYEFIILNKGKITSEQFFINDNSEEINKSEEVGTSTKQLSVVLDAKYKKAYLNKMMKNQCQNLTEKQRNGLIILLQKFKECFDGTLGNRKSDTLDF